MHSLHKTICILFLSVCLMVQGMSLAFSSQDGLGDDSASASPIAFLTDQVAAQSDASPECCNPLALHEEEADKDKSVEWKLDDQDSSSSSLFAVSNSLLKHLRADDDNYSSPSYPFHRPPNSLS